MNINKLLLSLLLLIAGASASLFAQTAVSVGSQVTSEADIVSGNAYLVYYVGNGNSAFMKDTGSAYNGKDDTYATENAVYTFTGNSVDGWQVRNYFTGKYWGKPTDDINTYIGSDTGGTWSLNFLSGGNMAPSCNGHSWNRSGSNIHPWSSGTANVNQFCIYEVAISITAPFSDFTDKDIVVGATEAASLTTATWYVMKNRGRNGYLYENTSSHSLYNQATAPTGSAADNANFLVRLVSADDGKFYLQNGLGNYFGVIPQNTSVPMTALHEEQLTVNKINNTDGHFYVQGASNSIVLDCQENGYQVVGWGTNVPTSTGGNNDWAFYPVEFVESWVPSIGEVYTINNTNTSRGALIYNPDANPNYVWSHGKSGTFNATQANSQWVIVPTATAKQYYLYNVGAGKFAIPTGIAQGAANPWVFSDNAVAVVFETQSDDTKKIKMATTPVSGTNAAYLSVSNGQTYPIINYNDIGSNFTITKVEGVDASEAVSAAVAKLVKNQTALTSFPQASGWYAIQIKSKNGSASYAGRYLQAANSLYNDLYPLTFTGGVDVQPAITDPTFFTYINHTSWDVNTWQLPDGRFLVDNGSNKFPTPSTTASNVICGYNGNYFKTNNNYYADPYNSNANYFIGETTTMRTAYTVYPIDLSAAGLEAWKVICDNAPDNAQITCSRSDVSGLTSVYKNGYFFLPTGVTPASTDFTLEGATSITVDADDKTVTLEYDPDLSIVAEGVSVTQGYQTAGRGNENALLLRIDVTPFAGMTSANLTVSLKDETKDNISSLYLYESDALEFIANIPNTKLATTTDFSTGTATLSLGDVTTGTHHYWLCATVKSDAALGTILDAAVTNIGYTSTSDSPKAMSCDLTAVGDPSKQGAKVFAQQLFFAKPTQDNCRYWRIPALIKVENGDLVAAIDKRYNSNSDLGNHKIDVVSYRSTDGGRTWGNQATVAAGDGFSASAYGFGDAALTRAANGDLVCLMAAGNVM